MTNYNGLEFGGQEQDWGKGDGTTGDDPVTFDCEYCEVILQTQTIKAMKHWGTTHLEAHKPTLFEIFAGKSRGKQCQNDCEYEFPVGGDQATGFECPQCGYDNFEDFAHRYLYWQIDYPEDRLLNSERH
ncbi:MULTISPECIES: hypothetical protein [Halorussus]|uniref:hypothetical protein n=1 Tax=Halorussus TaxID=1070314 RepID=UPI0013B3BF9E|nr:MULTISPECIES: hypothetical protein [Halorussus]NHN60402.1 hypothetical protein [Halorussus sp. JP-T4]